MAFHCLVCLYCAVCLVVVVGWWWWVTGSGTKGYTANPLFYLTRQNTLTLHLFHSSLLLLSISISVSGWHFMLMCAWPSQTVPQTDSYLKSCFVEHCLSLFLEVDWVEEIGFLPARECRCFSHPPPLTVSLPAFLLAVSARRGSSLGVNFFHSKLVLSLPWSTQHLHTHIWRDRHVSNMWSNQLHPRQHGDATPVYVGFPLLQGWSSVPSPFHVSL